MSLRRVPPVFTNVLPTAPSLRGRQGDVARLVAAVDDGVRLVTLLGPPGVGKTSLAATFAQRGPAAWVDLAAVETHAGFVRAVASAVGGQSTATPEAVGTMLARAPMWLVLDNLEQLTGSGVVETIEAWLHAARGLLVVATSRVRLALAQEFVHEVATLPTPGPHTGDPLRNDAVCLFLDRAVAAGASRDVLERDAASIVALVQQLDGLPLAIELAAAWTRVLTPNDILKRLERGDDVVAASADRHGMRRHQNLSEAIASSWRGLSTDEQRALAACTIFDGPFTIAAAERVIAAAVDAAPLEIIVGLRDKSLLQFEGSRLRLLVSIRDFVRACVATGLVEAETDAINAAFLRACVEIAERFVAAHFLLSAVTDSDIHALAPREHLHLLRALALCSAFDPAQWRQRALLLIATHELHATAVPDLAALVVHLDAGRAFSSGDDDVLDGETLRLLLLLCAERAAMAVGRPRIALERRHEFESRVGERLAVKAYACLRAGIMARAAGDIATAERCHAEVAELLSETEQPLLRLHGVNQACLGRLYCDRGDRDAAWEVNTAAAAICDSVGEVWLAALARANLAQLECEHEHYDRASEMLERALEHLQASAERKYVAVYAATYAGVCIERGRHNDAERWLGFAQQVFDPVGEPHVAVEVYCLTAMVAALAGDHQRARDAVLQAREADARAASLAATRVLVFAEGIVELCTPGAEVEGFLARWQQQAARVGLGIEEIDRRGPPWPTPLQHLDVRAARRLFLRTLKALGVGAGRAAPQHTAPLLRVGRDTMWFVIDDHHEDLARKGAMRRILHALLIAHVETPGAAISADALIAAGWQGERLLAEAASTRLRTAISALRKLGLRDVIQTRDDGYAIARGVMIEREPSR
jgi:predicted ATPase